MLNKLKKFVQASIDNSGFTSGILRYCTPTNVWDLKFQELRQKMIDAEKEMCEYLKAQGIDIYD